MPQKINKCSCGASEYNIEIAPFDDEQEAYYVHCMLCDKMGPVAVNDPDMKECVNLWNLQL